MQPRLVSISQPRSGFFPTREGDFHVPITNFISPVLGHQGSHLTATVPTMHRTPMNPHLSRGPIGEQAYVPSFRLSTHHPPYWSAPGSPGSVLSALPYTLFTVMSASHCSNYIVKFTNDTTVLCLITNKTRLYTGRRLKNSQLGVRNIIWSSSPKRQKKLWWTFAGLDSLSTSILHRKCVVKRVNSFKFLGLTVVDNLTWSTSTALAIA